MNWTLLVTNPARKVLGKFASKDQIRIEKALDELQNDPFSGDIKDLKPGWRRRVGNYRIFYDLFLDEKLVVVNAIERRTSTTY